jgi:PKD repeat protein
VTLRAVPLAGYVFDSWSGQTEGIADLHANPVTFLVGDRADNNRVITANFTECTSRYTVTSASEPSGGGLVTLDPEQTADGNLCNQSVLALATAQTGYVFDHWTGVLAGSENPRTVHVSENMSITAVFVSAEPGTDFSADKTVALVGQSIQFTDKSTGPVNSWQWDFGDGANQTVQNPSHSYSAAGT